MVITAIWTWRTDDDLQRGGNAESSAGYRASSVYLPEHRGRPAVPHTQSVTGRRLIACRNTGSTLVQTSFVSCRLECSSNRYVTAVDTPL
jgi:hypothetical protein